MSLRDYLDRLATQNKLIRVEVPISRRLECSGVLKKTEPAPVLFENVKGSPYRVAGNLFCTKAAFADYLGIPVNQIIPTLANAIENRRPCEIVINAPCQEVIDTKPDLNNLPLLRHCEEDGGNYISSGVFISRHPELGQNVDFHRAMQINENTLAIRVVRKRHFDAYLNELKQMDVAVCIGLPPTVLAAAATSVDIGVNELEIANALRPLQVVRATTVDVLIPAKTEFVLEGTVYLDRKHAEGPFVDLTETYDVIREEPVFEVKTITHRKDAIWQALLPGALEHRLLMGMPREPTIFNKVNQVARCLDVNVSPGGCSWLHAIVQIHKRHKDDGLRAIQAAFAGHTSCKHVAVVDDDIDIYNPLEVEWAMATRFQGDLGLVIKPRETGSSLDPSAEPGSNLTTKMGFDLTKPLHPAGKSFEKARFPDVNLADFLRR